MATQKEVAAHLDLSDRQIRELQSTGVIQRPSGRGEYDLDACRVGYIRHLRAVAAGHRSADGELDLTAERARLSKEQADAQALKNAEARGELVPASQIESTWVRLFSTARIRLLAVPSKVAPLVVGLEREAEVEAIVREHQTEALQELARARVTAEPEPDDED